MPGRRPELDPGGHRCGEVEGILSEDLDHADIHPPSLVRDIAGHEVEVMDCEAFCQGRPGLFPGYHS